VLTHPNGWELREQSKMRQSAIKAGLVSDMSATHRVHFVSEGEASLHFCMMKSALDSDALPVSLNCIVYQSSWLSSSLQDGSGCIIVDAGGGTVDISAYSKGSESNQVQEIAPSKCKSNLLMCNCIHSFLILSSVGVLQGSVFITRRAKEWLEGMKNTMV
jgi:hypothetical protein